MVVKAIGFGLSLVVLLAGCSIKPVKVGEVQKYELAAISSTEAMCKSPTAATLLVSVPSATPQFRTKKMLYMKYPYELSTFAKHQWVAPPSQMLGSLIVESLANTGCFQAVVSPPFAGVADLQLDVELIKLQQNFFEQPSVVDMEIKADLVASKRGKVLASHRFRVTVPTGADTPSSGVVAANEATDYLLTELVKFVVAYVG